MKFGLFYLPTYLPQSRDAATHFDNIVEQVLFADEIGIEYVWIDWEHCNECDNLSETILFRDSILQTLSA